MSEKSKQDGFTFDWSIENFSMCAFKSKECLKSPVFIVEMLEKSQWFLELYPNGHKDDNFLACFLSRGDSGKRPETAKISFSLTLVAADSSSEIKKVVESPSFSDSYDSWGFYYFANIEEIFKKKDVLIPNDVLTISCVLWGVGNDVKSVEIAADAQKTVVSHVFSENVTLFSALSEQMYAAAKEELEYFSKPLMPHQCSARTRIELRRCCITWSINRFSKRRLNQKSFLPVLSSLKDSSLFILSLCVTKRDNGEEDIQIDIQRNIHDSQIFVKCIIGILNNNMQTDGQDFAEDKHLFEANVEGDVWHFPQFVTRNKLFAKKGLLLKNDTLRLRCKFFVSRKGRGFHTDLNTFYPPCKNHDSTPNDVNELSSELLSAYKDQKFCDVSLRVGDRTITAHKGIICAASPVFAAMFENNMKEKVTGVVDITDVDSHTLDRMLKYVYSGVLEDMQQEDVLKLYSASDKYQVLSLRNRCSSLLESTLSVSNVCEVLKLLDMHQDHGLKTAVQDFISIRSREVFRSNEWKILMEVNLRIAGESMYNVLMNS